jgi:hypothetical protein
MLSKSQRMPILELHGHGMKVRQISKALRISLPVRL